MAKMHVLACAAVCAATALVACGGSTGDAPGSSGSSGSDGSSGSSGPGGSSGSSGGTGTSSGSSGSSGTSGSSGASGHTVTIALKGSTAPFAHTDGYSGETPTRQIVAIKSLWLLRSAADPSPVKVFDHGADAVETDLVTGNTTEIAKVPLADLPAGKFTRAKVGAAYVRYSVGARLHAAGGAYDGRYDNVQALSDGAKIDGTTHDKGWYRYSFAMGNTTVGTTEGENAPTPVATSTGGIVMDMSGPETFYVFPVELDVDPKTDADYTVLFEENVHQSFRWQDQDQPGYTAGVFDTTTSTFEPVMAFGGNSFKVTYAPK